jgi:hypothetical protein
VSSKAIVSGRALLAVLPVAVACTLWAASLHDVHVGRMNDLGLVSVLPASLLLALGLLTVSFCIRLRSGELSTPVLLVHLVALVVMLHALPPLVESVPRFHVAWRHAGVTNYILSTGKVDTQVDAYFNWPWFFIFSALITHAAGFHDAMALADWAPLAFNLLYLGPVLLIFSSVTEDKRLIWLGAFLFYVANWIGQDYFAPQGFAYFIYLVIVAAILRWFTRNPEAPATALGRAPPQAAPGADRRRMAVLVIVLVIFIATVPSHQLTPLIIVASVTALVLAKRCVVPSLPALMAVLLLTWITFATVAYLDGHLATLVSQIGDVKTAVSSNVSNRLQGSAEHLFVARMRIVVTAVLCGLAVLGAIRRFRLGHDDLRIAVLAGAPFPFFVLQPYGGEMLLRLYLFALPFICFFAAAFFFGASPSPVRRSTLAAVNVLGVALLGGFLITRYGNERMDVFTPKEVTAVDRLYAIATPGSHVVAVVDNLPWKSQHYVTYRYGLVADLPDWPSIDTVHPNLTGVVDEVADMTDQGGRNGYVIVTRSQKLTSDSAGPAPQGSLDRLERRLAQSPRFKMIYSNADAQILERVRLPGGSAQ